MRKKGINKEVVEYIVYGNVIKEVKKRNVGSEEDIDDGF
jgi:hypothetical protein